MYYVFLRIGSMFYKVHAREQFFRAYSLLQSWVLGIELKSSGLHGQHSYLMNHFISPKTSFNHY